MRLFAERVKKRGGLRKGKGGGGRGKRGKREIRKPQNKKNIEPIQQISPPQSPQPSDSLFPLPLSLPCSSLPCSPFATAFVPIHCSPPTASSPFTTATSLLFDSFLVESSDIRN
ncbi:hypothetical protein C4D60_Mb03t11400 [Musa balbisiana]|uniref:Uncharacterized protein n=1 Tax=Musa balbisiana TaxID=52838 RepID=A0A4V4H610_MUSBA|nr:hypothetical protein C4D60_Mb03t11400 [Musa balbisiana]